MIRGYLRLFFFAAGMLIGIQAPAFVIQYAQRVDAHYLEVKQNFSGFQRTADRHFNGDVDAMIRHHERSGDNVFIEGGENIKSIWQRLLRFEKEKAAMNASLHQQLWHLTTAADSELLYETRQAYNYTVPLDMDAVLYGVIAGFIAALLYDGLLTLLIFAFAPRLRRL